MIASQDYFSLAFEILRLLAHIVTFALVSAAFGSALLASACPRGLLETAITLDFIICHHVVVRSRA